MFANINDFRKNNCFPVFDCILENSLKNIFQCLGERKMEKRKKTKTTANANPPPQSTVNLLQTTVKKTHKPTAKPTQSDPPQPTQSNPPQPTTTHSIKPTPKPPPDTQTHPATHHRPPQINQEREQRKRKPIGVRIFSPASSGPDLGWRRSVRAAPASILKLSVLVPLSASTKRIRSREQRKTKPIGPAKKESREQRKIAEEESREQRAERVEKDSRGREQKASRVFIFFVKDFPVKKQTFSVDSISQQNKRPKMMKTFYVETNKALEVTIKKTSLKMILK
jgi:hypothetical protein